MYQPSHLLSVDCDIQKHISASYFGLRSTGGPESTIILLDKCPRRFSKDQIGVFNVQNFKSQHGAGRPMVTLEGITFRGETIS